jgi:hypothetical protein
MRGRVGPLRVTQLLRPARGPQFPKGPAAGGPDMLMRQRVAPAARARPVVPVGPTAGVAASRSTVQLRRGSQPVVPCGACGSMPVMQSRRWRSASGWAIRYGRGSSELVKAHTPRRDRPGCRNIQCAAAARDKRRRPSRGECRPSQGRISLTDVDPTKAGSRIRMWT